MTNKNILLTLIACVISAFSFIAVRYVWNGGDFSSRIGFSVFMSVLPAILAFLLLKLMKSQSATWLRTVGIYFLMFTITVFAQSYA
jgi:drug/metabolite transporter (DMT)-like permease